MHIPPTSPPFTVSNRHILHTSNPATFLLLFPHALQDASLQRSSSSPQSDLGCSPCFERSGSFAAVSSILENCQGKRAGYKKGRRSNPAHHGQTLISSQNDIRLLLSSGLYDSYRQWSSVPDRKVATIRSHSVIRWRQRRHLMAVASVFEEK